MPKFIIQFRANNAGPLQTLPEQVSARSMAGAIAQVAPTLADIAGDTLEIVATVACGERDSQRTALFGFGQVRQGDIRLTHAQAREYARMQPGSGYVWMLRRGHWCIVANYFDGSVWNGQSQIVPAPSDPRDDWNTLAEHR